MQPLYTNEVVKSFIQNGDVKALRQGIKNHQIVVNAKIGQYDDHERISSLVYAVGLSNLPYEAYESGASPLDKNTARKIVNLFLEKGAKLNKIETQVRNFQFEMNANERSFFVTDEMVKSMTAQIRAIRAAQK